MRPSFLLRRPPDNLYSLNERKLLLCFSSDMQVKYLLAILFKRWHSQAKGMVLMSTRNLSLCYIPYHYNLSSVDPILNRLSRHIPSRCCHQFIVGFGWLMSLSIFEVSSLPEGQSHDCRSTMPKSFAQLCNVWIHGRLKLKPNFLICEFY